MAARCMPRAYKEVGCARYLPYYPIHPVCYNAMGGRARVYLIGLGCCSQVYVAASHPRGIDMVLDDGFITYALKL